MTGFRRLICACAIAVCAVGAGAGAASAATFYVNERGTSVTCSAPGINACTTIKAAVTQAEKAPAPNTIEVEPETGGSTYSESIELNSSRDKGLTINGEEPGVIVAASAKHAVSVGAAAGAVTLSNLSIKATGAATVSDVGGELTLANDRIETESGEHGVHASAHGSLTILNSEISMESGATGYAVDAFETPLTLSGVVILTGAAASAEAGGVYSEKATLSVANTTVSVVGESANPLFGISAGKDSSVSIQNVRVSQSSRAVGVELEASPTTANGLTVEMVNPNSTVQAVGNTSETPVAGSTFSHLAVSGTWAGIGLASNAGELTLSDSHITVSPGHSSQALEYSDLGSGRGLLIQRSILQGATKANPGTLDVVGANATVDSSEILSGVSNVFFESPEGAHTLTIAGSSLGGVPGIIFEKPGVVGVDANASGTHASQANVAIEGSIVLNSQVATAATGDKATVTCSYSAVPSQIQTPNLLTHTGEIACAAGTTGNTNSSAEGASLFAEPFSNYSLKPTSSAIDSVPAGAIALPFGITPSATDLAGAPRVVDGNGDCIAVQDKGALELQGHSASCPLLVSPISPPKGSVPGPLAGVLTGLTISPRAFLAAPKGATLSRAAKKKYGAKITYRDSQAATTTFTILRPSSGRKQGKSCKKPSKHNRHGKRCTILTKVGSFTHADVAGADSLHFSGRIGGRKLPRGTYTLRAVTHDAAGSGAAVSKSFTIK
jgi:uncharacterized membrane protein